MVNAADPVRIKIVANGTGYKSIHGTVWNDVPDFAVITGRNGSGKTQLLEVLAHAFTNTHPAQGNFNLTVYAENIKIEPDQVGFVPSTGRFSGESNASIAQLREARNRLYSANHHSHYPEEAARAARTRRRLAGRDWMQATQHGNSALDENEFDDLLVDVDVTGNLATIFVAHRLKLLEAMERGRPGFTKEGRQLGPAPWDLVNESLQVADFPYRVVSPSEVGILDNYELRFRDRSGNFEIRPKDLSSGERILLQLNLWLFSSSKEGVFPKLLLLDEPDAHLHPSMTAQFLNVILEVLVRKHGIRVIMTTHSPSTVALAPEGSVFQMERGCEEVKPVTDRAAIISVLTAGLVTVSPASRYCFVEDEADVNFYNALVEILTDIGPSKDPCSIPGVPSLVFIAASVGQGVQKVSGGKSVVEKWVEKLDATPLLETFRGVIDLDKGNKPTDRVKVIGRYSFENYLLDPINVFGLLLGHGKSPEVVGVNLTAGDEHNLKLLAAGQLQSIADIITRKLEVDNPILKSTERETITYTRDISLQVPRWVVAHRGHELLQMYQAAWGGNKVVTPPNLIKALRRVRLIPIELAALLRELQG